MRILSLGAGVQSSTLLLMACEGELQIDAAIFADTQWEPAAVYEWLDLLQVKADEAGIPIYRVTHGSLRYDALHKPGSFAAMPLHASPSGMLRRQCTNEYKLRPIRRQLRELGATAKTPAEMLIGISLDEIHRMRSSDVRYVHHVYPLVDRRMSRLDCTNWLNAKGYPKPVKSACIGCPFHNNRDWREMREQRPADWADAVEFDAAVRQLPRIAGKVYLHSQLVPLDMVDLRSEQDRGQTEMFESDGCGVLCASETTQ